MTIDQLLSRVKSASVVEVLATIANDPQQARDFTLSFGSRIAHDFLNKDAKEHGIRRTDSSPLTMPRPSADWGRLDWARYRDYLKSVARGVTAAWRFADRVVGAFGKDNTVRYASLRAKLSSEDQEKLDRLCGRALAA